MALIAIGVLAYDAVVAPIASSVVVSRYSFQHPFRSTR